MSKINATYSSGYYLGPDADYRKLEDERALAQRKRRRDGNNNSADDGSAPAADDVKRQTFAVPFDVICLACNRRIVRGTHVYANRRATGDKYLNAIMIWALSMRCKYCQATFTLHTDPATAKETGGYVCAQGCRRVAGGFDEINRHNAAVAAAAAESAAHAAANPLEALERDNDAARALAERNRAIEDDVAANAEADDRALLQALRASAPATTSTTRMVAMAARLDDDERDVRDDDDKDDDGDDGDDGSARRVHAPTALDMQTIAREWRAQLTQRRHSAPLTSAVTAVTTAPPVAATTRVAHALRLHSGSAAADADDAQEAAALHALRRRYHMDKATSALHDTPLLRDDSRRSSGTTATPSRDVEQQHTATTTTATTTRRNVFVLAADDDSDGVSSTPCPSATHAHRHSTTTTMAHNNNNNNNNDNKSNTRQSDTKQSDDISSNSNRVVTRKHVARSALQRLLLDDDV